MPTTVFHNNHTGSSTLTKLLSPAPNPLNKTKNPEVTTWSLPVPTVEGEIPKYIPPGSLYADAEKDAYDPWLPQIVHADEICYQLVLPSQVSEVSCNTRQFCIPFSQRGPDEQDNVIPKYQTNTHWQHVLNFRSVMPTAPPTLQNREDAQYPTSNKPSYLSTITITLPPQQSNGQNGYPPYPWVYPQYTQNAPAANLPPGIIQPGSSQGGFPPGVLQPGVPELIDPFHPGSVLGAESRACRIPKIYEGICHPIVIPRIVISAYLLATYFYYSGARFCVNSPQAQPRSISQGTTPPARSQRCTPNRYMPAADYFRFLRQFRES
ncbi:hypothetical protein ABW20_dc0107426 [Dactylellina cionopaga]|nr:hypothetical protein ABW20_dc0107426 [Dactylellina cionopaga]